MDTGNEISSNTKNAQAVSPEEVRAALEVVVNSETLARADRARSLLVYLVKTEQKGDAARLKGFTIAQDVFGKDDDFDPAMDAVVRVQAGRLREHLTSFYAGEGKDEPIRITVPKGTYVPAYVRHETVPDATPRANGADGKAEIPRIVDFGASASAFKLDGAVKDGPLAATRALSDKPSAGAQDAFLSPFIVRNVKRFWLALAIIVLLLTVILVLVWRP
ncbi:MAG: hypothetical protein JJ920_02735 [Roseitalea sp.]|jgi:hypothetical protein|nr:hypothetical protein [Roseitalea sp.]MBO6723229.1 hypothetical protein [Roseitalea sp.]MBO6741799.1 hypothetical protein [Roseitalea sp.]